MFEVMEANQLLMKFSIFLRISLGHDLDSLLFVSCCQPQELQAYIDISPCPQGLDESIC